METRNLTYLSRPEILAELRREVGEVAEKCGLSAEEIQDVKLAVNEAVANIIEHAYDWRDDQPIIIRLLGREGEIEVRLRDFGKKVSRCKLRSRDLDDLREGGIGIFLMHSLMDEVIYDTSPEIGTELIMIKRHRTGAHDTGRGCEQAETPVSVVTGERPPDGAG